MTLTTARRQLANRLLNSSGDVITFAAGWAAGTAADRLLPRTAPGRLALILGSALAGALAVDELFFTATSPLRDQLRDPATTLVSPPATLKDARQALAADTLADAAHRAATRSYKLDLTGEGLLHQDKLWHGYDDGNAALVLAPGSVLFCRLDDGLAKYELAQADTREPVQITSLAQLVQLLPADTGLTDSLGDQALDPDLDPDLDLEQDAVVEPDLVLGATSVD